MDIVTRLGEIASRIDHLEVTAEWITRETVHTDNGVAQSATLITVLADNVRELVLSLVTELERASERSQLH